MGRNGIGKSTLLKLVAGIFPPQTGTIEAGGRVTSLLELGATLARDKPERPSPGDSPEPREEEIAGLEERIDALEAELPPLRRFILPGGSAAAAAFHLARTVCRRAERRVVALHRERTQSEFELRYLNRLSDLLFVMARTLNASDETEAQWRGSQGQPPDIA